MKRTISKKIVEPIDYKPVPQLLDTKSNYDDYSNLSYFISQHKRAVQIINECEAFYSNFLRNKLLSYSDIEKNPGINMLNMKFKLSEFVKNVLRLYDFYAYKILSKEFENRLKNYRYELGYKKDYNFNNGCYSEEYLCGYYIKAINNGIPFDENYLDFLISGYVHGRHSMTYEKSKYYQRSDIFFDKVIAKTCSDTKIAGFSKTDERCGEIKLNNKNILKVKTIDIERFVIRYDRKTKKDIYESTGEFDTFILFGKEEHEMIKILKEYKKKHFHIKNDMFLNPSKYIDLWQQYVKEILLNPKYCKQKTHRPVEKNKEIKIPGEYYIKHENNYKELRKLMFAPVDYMVGESGWVEKKITNKSRVTGKPIIQDDKFDEEEFIIGDFSIDGVNFLNKEMLEREFNASSNKKTFFYDSKVGDEIYINKQKLKLQIEAIHPESLCAFNKNINLLIDYNWYYILIDNTPYMFTNNLKNVNIQYNENKHILSCDYKDIERHKKAAWPGWLPWIVTTNMYHLEFDCNTNEPILYDYSYKQVEEKRE